MSTIAYIRQDKHFDAVLEQLQYINAYAISKNILIEDEFIDHISQNKRITQRTHVTDYFQSRKKSILLLYDAWVLSTNIEDLTQMFSCLSKNEFEVHFVKQSVIITAESKASLVLGLIDQLRIRMQEDNEKVVGRPKGSKSTSKFDKYMNEILKLIREKKNVSEMARILDVSRSSLKDYIVSRELKQVVSDSLLHEEVVNANEHVINSIICPNIEKGNE
ncbi:recombinase family protein [Sulfurimonas sp. SAG-AH-194-I05]|nr:recombinase family protein [Sulfurimonas sp. SAG-AH-194-I05]MDF1875353.1 recombinase family protein [Sulfurimonas sp. SAG-AH-194-I05]